MRRVLFFNRYTKSVEEEDVFFNRWLRLIYSTWCGQLGVFLLFKRKIFTMFLGWLASRHSSIKRIVPFIKKYDLKVDSFEKKVDDFTSFNDFFSRKLKPYSRPISPKLNSIISPVDGRHLAYSNMQNIGPFFVKGERLSVDDFIKDSKFSKKFVGGSLLISRLCPSDYHRFHFPLDCVPEKTYMINGEYSSIHPLAMQGYVDAYLKNKRMSTILHSETCGDVLMIEIGATGVGSVKQTFDPEKQVLKGDEKGYFEFGGSTVILIFENGTIQFSDDVLENTIRGMETYVLMGDEIATIL